MSRGRDANRPRSIPTAGYLDVLSRCWARLGPLKLGLIAAGIAFYGLLALFPAITAAVALTGIAVDPGLLADRSEWLLSAVPASAAELISAQIAEVAGAEEGALTLAAIVSVLIALWSASNGTGSMVQGLTSVYEEEETRGFVKLKLLNIALTVALILGLAVAVIVVAAIPAGLEWVGAGETLQTLANWLRWPIMFALGLLGISVLFRFGPDRRNALWRWVTPGAALGCVLWVLATLGFSFYIQNFGSYNETFGTLAGVIVLLTWLWISAFVILLGALFDAELEAQTRRDSTVGKERPAGQRGAFKADNIGRARGEAEAEKT
ncbi:YihY/virulence factor BrkB family protein [Maritimibacter dapengensis]|uniref:YihY/virulence factor BrkB family protein n=1 Tax=Maritimibacter dapengensis TaxID=2836868 RepID=A0ABS6T2D9_9RHOB|nr:YihY/virulence factor BrkB family protein [Maritimibacter dapengensis]MBV7378858.1 YihY/virulence factor BrkB family protein [Maritimibacter dapengensis]